MSIAIIMISRLTINRLTFEEVNKLELDGIRKAFHFYHMTRRNIIDKRFRDGGIYFGQPPILEYLNENPYATQKEIADHLGISPPSVAVSVKRMEKSGLLMRVCDKNDARRNNLQLTEKGRELLDFTHSTFDRIDDITFEGFTDEEITVLEDFLKRMNKNLSSAADNK